MDDQLPLAPPGLDHHGEVLPGDVWRSPDDDATFVAVTVRDGAYHDVAGVLIKDRAALPTAGYFLPSRRLVARWRLIERDSRIAA